jgi:hypothetical protein
MICRRVCCINTYVPWPMRATSSRSLVLVSNAALPRSRRVVQLDTTTVPRTVTTTAVEDA